MSELCDEARRLIEEAKGYFSIHGLLDEWGRDADNWTKLHSQKKYSEAYPNGWKHCVIHLNPETGQMHSDGDHSVREWIEANIRPTGENPCCEGRDAGLVNGSEN